MNPLDVYKKLPRTNCGKCSAGACMAFAVQFLRRMVSIAECPELDDASARGIEAMLSEAGDWKEKRLEELFREVSRINFSEIAEGIGASIEDNNLKIKYMGKEVVFNSTGFKDELDIWDKLLLLMYVKRAGSKPLSGRWVAFRDLKDGFIRAEGFHGACEIPLARMFENRGKDFVTRLTEMGAQKVTGFSSEYSYVINILPNIPFLVLLWPGDDEFSADCKVLLDSTATEFLDVEALLYLGMAFVRMTK